MTARIKKVLQYVLFLSIGVLLLYFTFKNTNPTELWNNIQSVDGFELFLAIGIGFGHHHPRHPLGTASSLSRL